MDSISNLPLLEIAEEDDSLLFDVSTATANVFACSPLLPLRSNPPQTEGRVGGAAVDSENPSSSLNENANKENADCNKPQKLSVEPQQMKRKKKGGGYNLRKSLAWDRAFFTEQGVLNPVELSMISGTATPKAGLNLEVIHEEESVGTSIELQEIEEDLFMHSSDAVPVEDRMIGATAGLSPKPGALPKASLAAAFLAARKVLTVNDSAGNRSKRSACPQLQAKRKVLTVNDSVGNRSKRSACQRLPVASSSLKKPDTVKAPSKELKLTRIPGPTTTARSGMLTTGSLKRNHNAHPATNLQKYAGVKGPSKNPKTVPSNPKFCLGDKCSVTRTLTKQAGKHLDNSVSETHPPSRVLQSGTEAKNKVSEACLPQGVSDIGEKKQQTRLQTTKSSGLRMPSPSLGFFSLAKAPSSYSQLQKSSRPCKPAKSNISKLQNLQRNSVNEARLPHAPGTRSQIVKGAAENCTEELSLLDVKSEPSMQVDNKQMAGAEVEYNSIGSETITKQEKVENILEHVDIKSKEQGELHRSENASSVEDVVFPRHEKKLLSKSHTQEQLEKEADHPDVLSNGYQSVFQEPQSMQYHGMQRISIVKGSISNTVHNAMGQDEDEQLKLLACDVLTSDESLVLQAKRGASLEDGRLSGDFKEYNSVKTALLDSSLADFSETVLGGSIQEIPFKNTEQVNDSAADFVTSGGDAQVHLLNGNLSYNCNETTESNLEAVNQQLQGELMTTSASIVGEISSTKENESHVNSCQLVHMTTLSSEGSPQKSIPEINCPAESETKIAEIEDCRFPVDDQSGFIQTRPVLEGCEKVIDSKAMHDDTQAFELDRMGENCIAVSAIACNTKVSNISQESRPFHENNVENLHFKSQLCPIVKADFDSSENEVSTNNCCMISELQLRDEGSSRDASMHYDVPCDVPGNFEQQTSMITYSKANKMLCEDESLVPNHGHLLDQSEFSEVSADFISNARDSIDNGAEKSSGCLQHTLLAQLVREVDHTNGEIEESHMEDAQVQSFNENPVAYNCNNSENANNILHLDGDWLPTNIASEEIKKTVEDAQVQLFNENPAAYNCNSKQCLVVTNDKFPLADNNNINEDSHLSDFQRPGAVGGVGSENVNTIHLDGDWLPTNIVSSEEIKKTNLFESALEGCDIYTSEHNASTHHIQAMAEMKDGTIEVDERAELLQMDDSKGSFDVLPLVEVQLNDNIISSECNSSIEVTKDSFTDVVTWKSEEHCSLSESSNLPASDNLTFNTTIPQACEVSSSNSKSFSDEAETDIFEKDEFPNIDMQHQSKGGIYFAEDSSKIIHLQISVTKSKQEVPTVKPVPNAAPFADERLAAIEDAGELNQNSPHGDWQETVSATACDTKLRDDGSSRDASMHYDVQCDVPANLEHQNSMITYSKANEMLCEYESLVLNRDHLVDQSEFSEVPADFISNTKDSIGSGAEIPAGHLQHTLLAQFVQEFDHTNREIEESYMEDAQVQSFTENSVAYNCNSKHCLAVTNEKFPSADNNNINEDSRLSDFQRPGAVVGVDSQKFDNIVHLDGDWLPTNIASFEEIKKTNSSEDALEGCDIDTSEHKVSNHHIQAMPENKDGNLDVDEREELLQMDAAKKGSSDILPLVEVQLNDKVVSSECDSSIEISKDSFTDVVAWKSEEHCSLSENSNLPALDNLTFNTRIPQVCEVSSLNSTNLSDEAETIFEKDEFPNSNMQHQSKGDIYSAEDSSKIIHLQKSATKSNQDFPTVKPSPNAAPFSDEWLAAIEAAGEEILTMKSGAVQNSPPDKPQHEPGPWSPVRRKNQSIGPFDCTKHNIQHSSS